MYKLGDKVTWKSQAGGHAKIKTGIIIKVIPPNHDFLTCIRATTEYKLAYGGGRPRDYESYAVLVKDSNGKGVLYWPRVSQLSAICAEENND